MGLSQARIEKHIQQWEAEFKKDPSRGYRTKWPKYLFRHERVESAARILLAGNLLSRTAATQYGFTDIAPPEVIGLRDTAHELVRLYFRPRNPTQFHVEGIKRVGDFFEGNTAVHAPVLIMLMFKSRSVLELETTQFSNGNMQRHDAKKGKSEEFFNAIPFERVYHDQAFSSNEKDSILFSRCAEVLAESPLPLSDHLAYVLCRSEAERRTLLHLAPNLSDELKKRIRTYSEVGIFQNSHAFVKSVGVGPNGVTFAIHPRRDGQDVKLAIEIKSVQSAKVVASVVDKIITPSKPWHLKRDLGEDKYLVTIRIDDQLAYKAVSTVTGQPF